VPLGTLLVMSMILCAAAASDLGPVRENNEDASYAGRRLVAVADGMGGMPAGELASEIVMRELAALEEAAVDHPLPTLLNAIETANRQIRKAADADASRDGMGTTVTALFLSGDELALLHVGDSRAYLLRDGTLRQLTRDETLVQALVDRGVLSADEARNHPRRSVVLRAVQGDALSPDGTLLAAQAGDRFLVCSDGLSDVVPDELLREALLAHPDPRACAQRLVGLALAAGGTDNVTAIVADLVAE
jgi:protein phosphatase